MLRLFAADEGPRLSAGRPRRRPRAEWERREAAKNQPCDSDVAELLAGAGILDVDVDDAVADEHVRSSAYQRVVSVTASSRSRDRDRAIAATILRDPIEMVSKTAVVALVDRIAMKVTGPAEFRQWSVELLPEIDQLKTEGYREFIRRRINDWLFYLSIEDGHVPTPAELAKVTDYATRPRRGVDAAGGTRPARRVGQHQEDTKHREEPSRKPQAENEMSR
ncbi:hypothetical protein [Streptomyces botrytidirepellens]|uniref:hypothetical protein n=1 Tax=Streptomyces botrytidirepellens TaxID=2486417 RepID=UPI001C8342F9|nr:hypothetical protein [Streptomyces botrytidirepellens]